MCRRMRTLWLDVVSGWGFSASAAGLTHVVVLARGELAGGVSTGGFSPRLTQTAV